MDKKDELKKFLLSELAFDLTEASLTDDYDLLTSGIIDSMGIVKIASFMEEKFNIAVKPEDMIADNFRTVLSLENFINQKQK